MQPTLNAKNVMLRPFKSNDALRVQLLAGDARVVEMTENIPHPYEDGMAEAWIERITLGWENRTIASFAICPENTNELVGCCSLQISKEHKRATLGYWIGVDNWGKGYGTQAASAVVAFGFEQLGLRRIQAEHLTKNPASGAVMRKVGMLHEATKVDYAYKNGRYENMESYYILSNMC